MEMIVVEIMYYIPDDHLNSSIFLVTNISWLANRAFRNVRDILIKIIPKSTILFMILF